MQEHPWKIFSFARLRLFVRRFRMLLVLAFIAGAGGGTLFIPYGGRPEYTVRELLLCRCVECQSGEEFHPLRTEKVVEQLNALIQRKDFGCNVRKYLDIAEMALPDDEIDFSISSADIPGVVEVICRHSDPHLITDMVEALKYLWQEYRSSLPGNEHIPNLTSWVQEDPVLSKTAIFKTLFIRSFCGGAGCLILAFIAVLFISRNKNEINIRTLEREAGMPVFGVIPEMPIESDGKAQQGFSRIYYDAVCSLRDNLGFMRIDPFPGKILLVASLEKYSGSGQTASTLAAAVTFLNKRVLLIEADFRRRHRNWFFTLPENQAGLSEVLSGTAKLENVIQRNINGFTLDVLPKGSFVNPPGSLFRGRNVEELLHRLDAEYDYILLDAPAFLEYNDSMILGRLADAVLLMCDYRRCCCEKLHLAMWRMRKSDVNIAGFAIEHFPLHGRRSYFYNYQSSFYQYTGE